MDPHTHSGQPVLSPNSGRGDDSVDYLRRLRKEAPKDASADAEAKGAGKAQAAIATTAPVMEERRKSPRVRCTGSAEFRTEGSQIQTFGQLIDISLHGCYVEMTQTFPVGTKVHLVLRAGGIGVQTSGTVRASYPFLGMGISLTEIEPGQLVQLNRLLASLQGSNAK